MILYGLSSKQTMVQIKHNCTNLTFKRYRKKGFRSLFALHITGFISTEDCIHPIHCQCGTVLPLRTLRYDGYYVCISILFDIWCPPVNVTMEYNCVDKMLPWQKHIINEHSQGYTLSSSCYVCLIDQFGTNALNLFYCIFKSTFRSYHKNSFN